MKQQAITFIVSQSDPDGGYVASAYWRNGNRNIVTEADDREELLRNIRDAIDAAFDETDEKPELVHLHFVRDEMLVLDESGNGSADRYPLRGKSYRFDNPHAPVGIEDWEALK
jgi:predicted RNase H-like HicB family nuclease